MQGSGQADQPWSWWRLGPGGWKAVLKATAGQFKEDNILSLAALVTLRLVLALVPSLIAAVAIIAQFTSTADLERLVAQAEGFIPDQARDFVINSLDRILNDESGSVASVVGVLVGLFAASSAAVALVKALNGAYDVEEERGLVRQRLVSLVIVLALLVTLIGIFIALILGPSLIDWLLPQAIMDSPLRILIGVGRYAVAVALLITFFGFAFRLGPNRDQTRMRPLTPGAVFGVLGWLLLSYLFSLYVRIAGDYAVYGAAAGVVILLIWLNYSFIVLLMGAELDHEIERHVLSQREERSREGAGSTDRPAEEEDLDAVVAGMPRHPGLVPAAEPRTSPPPADEGDPVPPLRVPHLVGAAKRTAGAMLAHRLWGRAGG